MTTAHPCRGCGEALPPPFLDLGHAPPSNAYRDPDGRSTPETRWPLRLQVCTRCRLVQVADDLPPDTLFTADYAYHSSVSASWTAHAARFVEEAVSRFQLGAGSRVVEIAANDGYLLRHVAARGIPCLGVEPAASPARIARALGLQMREAFFGSDLADRLLAEGWQADLIVANNVYAHVPGLADFTRGLATLLAPGGTISIEMPHVMNLLAEAQFDTVYHEHYSYFSLLAAESVLGRHGLKVVEATLLPTHGGSLRLFVAHQSDPRPPSAAVLALREREAAAGLDADASYAALQARAERLRDDLMLFLVDAKRRGCTVAGYGAAAKGNTLLNFAGIRPDLLPYVCDAATSKQGRLLPGSHIPIEPPARLFDAPPDYLLVLPWNLLGEIRAQLAELATRGTRFVTAIPHLAIDGSPLQ